MIEATATIRASRRNAGEGFDRKIASITEEHDAFLRQSDDLIDRALIGHVPWGQRTMTTKTAFRVPYGLHLGAGLCCTPSSTGKSRVEFFGQCKSRTVSNIDVGKGRNQAIITPRVEGLELCQGRLDHVLQQGHGFLVQALMHGCRRDVHLRAQWGDRRRQWCQRRLGLTPGPKRYKGQTKGARHLRRAFANASAPHGGCDIV